jgi:colicin import membrane protein
MALKKQTVLSQIEVQPDGTLQIRLAKQVVDGDEVFASDYHRTAIPPGHSVDDQMNAVDADLINNHGFPALDKAERDRIKAHAKVAHTPDAVQAYRKRIEDAQKTADAENALAKAQEEAEAAEAKARSEAVHEMLRKAREEGQAAAAAEAAAAEKAAAKEAKAAKASAAKEK